MKMLFFSVSKKQLIMGNNTSTPTAASPLTSSSTNINNMSSSSLNASTTDSSKPKCKPCCACPETRQKRDDCVIVKGEENCMDLIRAHQECMRKEGVKDSRIARVSEETRKAWNVYRQWCVWSELDGGNSGLTGRQTIMLSVSCQSKRLRNGSQICISMNANFLNERGD